MLNIRIADSTQNVNYKLLGALWYFRNQVKLQNVGDTLIFKLQKPGRILNVELQNVECTQMLNYWNEADWVA